jgi:hypothetical protein
VTPAQCGLRRAFAVVRRLKRVIGLGRVLEHAKGTSSDAGNGRWHLNVLYRY